MTDSERLAEYDRLLSEVMPPDFKDWWENSKDEWPLVAQMVIKQLREREEIAWKMLEQANERSKVLQAYFPSQIGRVPLDEIIRSTVGQTGDQQ